MTVYRDKFHNTTNRNLLKQKEFIFPLRNPKIVVYDNMKEINKRDYNHDALMRSTNGIPRKRFVCVDCGFARKRIHQIELHQSQVHQKEKWLLDRAEGLTTGNFKPKYITKNGKKIRIR